MRYDGQGFVHPLEGDLPWLDDVHVVISDEDAAAFFTRRRHAWRGSIESESRDLMTFFGDAGEFLLGISGYRPTVARVESFDRGCSRASSRGRTVGCGPQGRVSNGLRHALTHWAA
ncbi:hypothetical protein GCM10009740_38490 [Terrabacter terrae]|uniref:Uncharacterized protein n=1 Tax=Terrabacter terrae TaxID=318434 RepID=A0ABP4KFC9_9MICO